MRQQGLSGPLGRCVVCGASSFVWCIDDGTHLCARCNGTLHSRSTDAARQDRVELAQYTAWTSSETLVDISVVPDIFRPETNGRRPGTAVQSRLARQMAGRAVVPEGASFFTVPDPDVVPDSPPVTFNVPSTQDIERQMPPLVNAVPKDSQRWPTHAIDEIVSGSRTLAGKPPAVTAPLSRNAAAAPRQPAASAPAGKPDTVLPYTATQSLFPYPCASFLPAPTMMHIQPWGSHGAPLGGPRVLPFGMNLQFPPTDGLLPHLQQLQMVSAATFRRAPPQAPTSSTPGNHPLSLVAHCTDAMPRTLSECTQYLPLGLRSHVAARLKAAAVQRSESLQRFRDKKTRSTGVRAGPRYMGRKRYAEVRPRAGGRFINRQPSVDGPPECALEPLKHDPPSA
eukprot:jgi/Ulvmu1/9628/UM054_0058.1